MIAPIVTLSGTPILHTDRLTLRAPQVGDHPHWADFAMSERARYVGGPLDAALAWRALGHLTGHWVHRGFGMFIFHAKSDDTPLGMAGPWFPGGWPEREIGWSVWASAAEGKGFAFEAAAAVRAYAYQTLGWDTAVSYINPANVRSISLAQRLGAILDPDAAHPGTEPCLVYRHPAPGAMQ
jgi:RimJ/RimL family protein N-acetyltransferase